MQASVADRIVRQGVVPVVRADSVERAEQVAVTLHGAGMDVVEITFTVPGAAGLIERLRRRIPDALVGAGTVLDAETARLAVLAGAQFLVSVVPARGVALVGNRYGVPFVLGGQTPYEVLQAAEAGSTFVKLFPASVVGPGFLREMRGPLPGVRFLPTGGITEESMGVWFEQGAAAVGLGSSLIGREPVFDPGALTIRVQRCLEQVRALRQGG